MPATPPRAAASRLHRRRLAAVTRTSSDGEGDFWSVVFENQTARLRDLKGMHYLARLLADPGKEFHVVDLVAGGAGESQRHPGGGTSGADARTGAGMRFETTQWSLVLAAGQGGSAAAEHALARLCALYWYPVFAFVRSRGRFRSFLLTACQNYRHEDDRAHTQKRGGGQMIVLRLSRQ